MLVITAHSNILISQSVFVMAAKDLKPVKMSRFRPGMDFTKAKNVLGLSSNLRLEEIRADVLQAKFVSQLNKVIQSNFIIHPIFILLF